MTVQVNALETENSELKRENAELLKERDKYKKLFDVSADALSIIDLDSGQFIECNRSAIEMHGVHSIENFLELRPSDLSPPLQPSGRSSEEMANEHIAKALKNGSEVFQWTHSRLDGSTFSCLVSLTSLSIGDDNLILAIGRNITDLINTQTELKEAALASKRFEEAYLGEKEKFEKFVDLAPIGIAINSIKDGSFEFVNQEFGRMTGYSVEELNKMDYWQLTPKKYESQEQVQLNSLNDHGKYGPYSKEYIHKTGRTYPVLLSGIKITDSKNETYIWSVVQDVSQQKEIENQIKDSKAQADSLALRMQLANDSAGIGVWDWNLETGELLWDSWMYKLYGVKEEQFSGAYEAWASSVHPDDIEEAKLKLDAAINGSGKYEPEFRVVHPDGAIRTMKASAEVFRNPNGEATSIVGVNYDVTDKVDAISVLSDAKLTAENATRAQSDFLANMSHEIRTPMNAILGALQLLQDTDLSNDLTKVLNNATFSAQSLLTLINDILDYSKIESNHMQLEDLQFSLTEVLDSVAYDLDSLVSAKRIEFVVTKDKNFKEYWTGDLVRTKQIILNLASNAVKFTDEGKVQINIGSQDNEGEQAIYFEVIDSGIGMSEEATKRVFERFSQADSSTTRKYGGTGLGMSITISLIKMMGGEISIDSILDKGTTVKVILPLKSVDFAIKNKAKQSLSVPNLVNQRILIAEDNVINKVLVESMLSATNANLTIVENGQLAVEAVKNETFDLVLMDIHMPIMDGIEAQQLIKSINPSIPVIALTANVMTEDVERYAEQGFAEHIAKPIVLSELYGVLKHCLKSTTL